MPIYYKPSMQELPFTFDSIGNHWTQESVSRPKGFPLYHWLQTESGEGTVTLEGTDVILKSGEGILISPHTPHRYRPAKAAWTTSFLTLSGTLSSEIRKICGDSSWLAVNAQEGRYFQEWIDETLTAWLANRLEDLTLSVRCYEFIMRFSVIYRNRSKTEHPLYRQYVRPVMERIETDYAESLTVDGLAFSVHISPQYLTRLFKRFTDCSVQDYITHFRISKAKELLIGMPYLRIENVAYMAGYNDVSYFICMFRKQAGITPRQFRKSYGLVSS